MSRPLSLVVAVLLILSPSVAVSRETARAPDVHAEFKTIVANLEYSTVGFSPEAPDGVTGRSAAAASTIWYGRIARRLPGEGPRESRHYVPFAVEYSHGSASKAWCDLDFDGDLNDEAPLPLNLYPVGHDARSFLVDLRWTSRIGEKELKIERKVRVVLKPQADEQAPPEYRVELVHAMGGSVVIAGKAHDAVLFDGDGDGLYTDQFGDGVFIDLDDNSHFDVDQMSEEFGPFSVPFAMAGGLWQLGSVDPEGRELTLRYLHASPETSPVKVGKPAPRFSYKDSEGHDWNLADLHGRPALVYFWATWCGNCRRQSEQLKRIYERFHGGGLEILAVSYDTDRAAMEAFRVSNGHSWPTSFSGHMLWEDPVGRLYHARAPCAAYLVDQEGLLDGIFGDMDQLEARLEKVTATIATKAASIKP